jgi:hypothetical protein
MFKLNRVTRIGGDETAGYEVLLDKEYTVKSLLETVVGIKSEWGYFSVKNGSSCEYRWGKLLSQLNKNDLDKKVKQVKASGGWSRMDYYVETV